MHTWLVCLKSKSMALNWTSILRSWWHYNGFLDSFFVQFHIKLWQITENCISFCDPYRETSLFWTDKQLENGLCNYKSLCTEVSRKWDLDKKNVAFVRNSSYPDPKWLFSSNCKASENGPTHGDKTIKDWRIDCCRRSNVHSRWLNELDVDLIWQKSEISQLDIRAWVGKTFVVFDH